MVLPPERRDEIVTMLRLLVGPISVSTGCLKCGVFYDATDENVVCWEEEWQSRKDLYRHIASTEYRQILAALDLAIEKPEIRFEHISDTRGMELIVSVRSNNKSVTSGGLDS